MALNTTTSLVYSPHPIEAGVNRSFISLDFKGGETINECLERAGIAQQVLAGDVILAINGRVIDVNDWGIVCPGPMDLITIRGTVHGDDAGSNPIAIVLSLAVLIAAPYLGPIVAGALNIEAAWAISAVTAVIAYSGVTLINALLPPPNKNMDNSGGLPDESPTYSLAGGSNQARRYSVIPVVVGEHRIFPDLIVKPYTGFRGNEQYLYQLFGFGLQIMDDADVTELNFGDTNITSYDDVELLWDDTRVGNNTLFPSNVDSDSGAGVLTEGDSYVERSTAADTTAIELDVVSVLFSTDKENGNLIQLTAILDIEYKLDSDSTWSKFVPPATHTGALTASRQVIGTRNVGEYYYIGLDRFERYVREPVYRHWFAGPNWASLGFRVNDNIQVSGFSNSVNNGTFKVRRIDGTTLDVSRRSSNANLLQPEIASSGVTATALTTEVSIVGTQRNQQRVTYRRTVTKGTYNVRMRWLRTDGASQPDVDQKNIVWNTIRSFQPDDNQYTGQNILALSIRASGQLSGTVDRLSAIVKSKCEEWTGSVWSLTHNSNPAWWYRHIAKGLTDPITGELTYGGSYTDAELDLDVIKAWGAWCDTNNLECNVVFDQNLTLFDMLSTVARAGRASVSWSNGKLGVVYNQASLPVTAVYNMNNIALGSFEIEYVSGEVAEEVQVDFINKDLAWERDTVRRVVPGVTTTPTRIAKIQLPGVTSVEQAGRECNLIAAAQYYHNRRYKWRTDMEGMVTQRGDVVQLQHDITGWGEGARLANSTPTNRPDRVLLDREVTFVSGQAHYVTIRHPDGGIQNLSVIGNEEKLLNPGFEAGELTTAWTTNDEGTYQDTVVQDVEVDAGTYAAHIEVVATGGTGGTHYILIQEVTWANNGALEFTARVKGPVGRFYFAKLERILDGGTDTQAGTQNIALTGSWQDVSISLDSWERLLDTTSVKVYIGFSDVGLVVGEDIYVDEVSLKGQPSAWDLTETELLLDGALTEYPQYVDNYAVSTDMDGAVAGALGGVGSLPPGWTYGDGSGEVTWTVIGTGTEGDQKYLEIEVNGTNNSGSIKYPFISPTMALDGVPVGQWEAFTVQVNTKYISGTKDVSVTGRLVAKQETLVGGDDGQSSTDITFGGTIEYDTVGKNSFSADRLGYIRIEFVLPNTDSLNNYRFRVYEPQLEFGPYANNYVENPNATHTADWGTALSQDWLWVFDNQSLPGRKAKVIDIRPQGDKLVELIAIDERDEYYAAEDDEYLYTPPATFGLIPPTLENLEITEELIQVGNSLMVKINLQWDVTGGDYYRAVVRAGCCLMELQHKASTYSSDASVEWQPYGFIYIEVRGMTADGKSDQSSVLSLAYDIQGASLPPPDVSSFNVVRQPDGTREFSWSMPYKVVDLAGFVIRARAGTGHDWDDLYSLHDGLITENPWETNQLAAGQYTLAIKAEDTSGNRSTQELAVVSTLGDPRIPNVLYFVNFLYEGWSGTKTYCFVDPEDSTLRAESIYTWATRTQWVRNSTFSGTVTGTPGTLPDWYYYRTTTGMTWTIHGTGTEYGMHYLEVSVNGSVTPASTTGIEIGDPNTTRYLSHVPGADLAASSFFKYISGTTSANLTMSIGIYDGAQPTVNYVEDLGSFTVANTGQLEVFQATVTSNDIDARRAILHYLINFGASGSATNYRFRIYYSTLESGPTVDLPPIYNDSTSNSRALSYTWDQWSSYVFELTRIMIYESAEIDLTGTTADVTFTPLLGFVGDNFAGNLLEYDYKPDGGAYQDEWADAQLAVPVTARYIKIRVIAWPETHANLEAIINQLTFTASGEVIIEEVNDFDTSTLTPETGGGVRLPLSKSFTVITSVQIAMQSVGAGYTWELIDRNASSGPHIKMWDSTNTIDNGVTIDYVIRGF